MADPLPLAVIPAYLSEPSDLMLLNATIASLHATARHELVVLVVDDRSPATELVELLEAERRDLGIELVRKPENTGFSATVNVGLRRALAEGRDAILVNADVQLLTPGWVEIMRRQPNLLGDGLAAVVGAMLIYPNGLIQHGGIYFSLLTRTFDHLFKYGPAELAEANVEAVRPVTGALQFIRHECLMAVGVYDEQFRMGYEDVDYGLRVMISGRECVYQPAVRAIHYESVFRGRPSEKLDRWHRESLLALWSKYRDQSFAGLVPAL
jgi:GT2 family glycosyltransferase